MPRVKVNNCVIMVGKEPLTISIRFVFISSNKDRAFASDQVGESFAQNVCRSLIRLGGLFLALRLNQKGAVDVTNSPASVDKVALFLRLWVVNAFDCRMDYHNEAVG
jgi:hypothetical protein